MAAKLRFGTSGYSFNDWVGIVYPEGTRASDFLSTYAKDFDAVEVNFTYYRDPTPEIFEGMLRKVSADFDFVIKAPKGMTHDRTKLAASSETFVTALKPLIDEGQLGGVLLQFPQSFHPTDAAFDHLKNVADVFIPMGVDTNVEFRHKDWNQDCVYELLERLNLGFVNVDLPKLDALPGQTNIVTSDVAYYRLHGRNADMWYKPPSGSYRYDYLYNDSELEEWALRVEESLDHAEKVYVFNNNCHKGSSFANALRLKQRFDQTVRSEADAEATLFASADPEHRITELTRRVTEARSGEREFVQSHIRKLREDAGSSRSA